MLNLPMPAVRTIDLRNEVHSKHRAARSAGRCTGRWEPCAKAARSFYCSIDAAIRPAWVMGRWVSRLRGTQPRRCTPITASQSSSVILKEVSRILPALLTRTAGRPGPRRRAAGGGDLVGGRRRAVDTDGQHRARPPT